MTNNIPQIATDIKNIRLQKNLSIYALSKITGITQSSISRFEAGKTSIKSNLLLKLLDGLNCEIAVIAK